MSNETQILESVGSATRVVIATHEKPDGDALGASLALCRILRDAGHPSVIMNLGPVPERYHPFVADDEVATEPRPQPTPGEILVVLDSGAADRAPPFVAEWQGRVPLVNIDHHLSNDRFGTINWVDPACSSAGEMIYRLACTAGWEISTSAAEALWVAIVTDTGRFAYENTSPEVLTMAAALVARGVRTAEIDRQVYESVSERELRVRGLALESLELHAGGRIALVSLSRADFTRLGAGPADAEDVVNLPRSVRGVELAFFAYELEEKGTDGGLRVRTKLSVRSKEPHDAAALCARFGGGGHARAAGCTLHAPLPEAKQTFLDAAKGLLECERP
jgi:phosphoesterase RecJ-like protein